MTLSNPRHVILVGPFPPPIGGVSSHVLRLSSLLVKGGHKCTVLDMYSQSSKAVPADVVHCVCKYRNPFLVLFWLLCILWRMPGDIVHFHFSRIVGWFPFVAALMSKRGRKLLLTLHHGNQSRLVENISMPYKSLIGYSLSRVDLIVALSPDQESFYKGFGIPNENLIRLSSNIPNRVSPNAALLPEYLSSIKVSANEAIIVTSGYPSPDYGYESSIKLLDYINELIPCRLVVSLYGKAANTAYEIELRHKLLAHPKVIVVSPLPMPGFLALLQKADLYVRPSMVDSYGLAITDALDLGVQCLASDICVRDPRCKTYPAGDTDAFIEKACEMLQASRKSRGTTVSDTAAQFNPETVLAVYR